MTPDGQGQGHRLRHRARRRRRRHHPHRRGDGHPQYLSPEQAEGKPATAASDVYALGVVAFECLAGRRPFEADSPVATALAHIREPVPDLPGAGPAPTSPPSSRRSLAKDPAERYRRRRRVRGRTARPGHRAGAPRRPSCRSPPPRLRHPGAAPRSPSPTPSRHPPRPWPARPPTAAEEAGWPIVLAVVLLVALGVVLTRRCSPVTTTTAPATTPPTLTQPTTRAGPQRASSPTEPHRRTPTIVDSTPTTTSDRPVDDVEAELRDLGLRVQRDEQPNDDPDRDGHWSPPSTRTATSSRGHLDHRHATGARHPRRSPSPTTPSRRPSEPPPETLTETTVGHRPSLRQPHQHRRRRRGRPPSPQHPGSHSHERPPGTRR